MKTVISTKLEEQDIKFLKELTEKFSNENNVSETLRKIVINSNKLYINNIDITDDIIINKLIMVFKRSND